MINFAGHSFIILGLLYPFYPRLGEKFTFRCEVTEDMLFFRMPGPDQFIGIGDNGLLPEWVDIGDQDFFTVVVDLLTGP